MATVVGYDDSQARAFQQLLSLGLNMDQRRRDRQFDQARYLNSIGKNPEAEQLMAQSQRGLLGNLFAGKAEGRKFSNPYAGPEQALLDVPKLNAQQEIVAELQSLYDGDEAGYQKNMQALAGGLPDSERARQLQGLSGNQKIYEAAADAYRSQYGNDLSDADIKAQYQQDFFRGGKLLGRNDLPDHIRDAYLSSRAEVDRLSGYNPMDGIRSNEQAIQRQAQIQAQNEAIKKANAERYFEGDEDDVIDSLTEIAYREIQNAPTYQEKVKKYAQYKNKHDSIRKSFQGQGAGRALDMEQMGVIKPGSGGGASVKTESMNIYDKKGNHIGVYEVPKSILTGKTPRTDMWKRFGNELKDMGIEDYKSFRYSRAGTENTDLAGRDVKTKQEQFEQDLMEDAVFQKRVSDNVGFWDKAKQMIDMGKWSPEEAERRAYNAKLDAEFDREKPRVHPVTGEQLSFDQYARLVYGDAPGKATGSNEPESDKSRPWR